MAHLFLGICCMLIVATYAACSDDAHCGYIPAAVDSSDYRYAHGSEDSDEFVQLLQMGPPLMKRGPKQTMSPGQAYVLYKHVHLLQQLLAQKQIVAWATGGTLLGATRNGGVIPHDNDADFTVFKKDVPNAIAALQPSMKVSRYETFDGSIRRDVYKTRYNDAYDGSNYESVVDIFVAEKLVRFGTYTDPSKIALQDQLKNRSAQLEFMQSLVSKEFGCTTVMVSSQDVSNQYLDMTYGANWNTTVSCEGTWHECELLDDNGYELHNMALPCYDPEDGAMDGPGDWFGLDSLVALRESE